MRDKRSGLFAFFLAYDIIIMIVAFLGSIYLKYHSLQPGNYTIFLPLVIALWTLTRLFTSRNLKFREGLITHFKEQVVDMVIMVGIVSSVVLIFELRLYSRTVLFGTITFFFVFRNVGLLIVYRYLFYMRHKGRHVRRVLIIGAGRIGKRIYQVLSKDPTLGYFVVGFLDDAEVDEEISDHVLGRVDDIGQVIERHRIEEVVLAIPLTATEKIRKVIDESEFHGLRVSMVPDYYRLVKRTFEARNLAGMPLVSFREVALDKSINKVLKRIFDMLFAFGVLVVLSPVLLLIAVIIKVTSPGPVFYRPTRIGLQGKEFTCLKFRSMIVDSSPDHHLKSTQKDDPRITRVGAYLRKHSLDELPQFINVLTGDMSVVGPRPHRKALNVDMQNEVSGYMLRHYVKPGITGWAQVNGWRGPTETKEQREQRTLHDLWYVENWSFLLDIRIIFMTIIGRSKENAF